MDERAEWAFAEVIGDGDQTVLLIEKNGKVAAGVYLDSLGKDVSAEIGSALGPIGAEASKAMRHLPLGSWRALSVECEDANLGLSPAGEGQVVLVAAAPTVPIGFVRRLLDRAAERALAWREEVA
jgi:predicted regulator of Ras-like GTPase activity (Roadblock/LC7/MglB family)